MTKIEMSLDSGTRIAFEREIFSSENTILTITPTDGPPIQIKFDGSELLLLHHTLDAHAYQMTANAVKNKHAQRQGVLASLPSELRAALEQFGGMPNKLFGTDPNEENRDNG